MSIYDFNTPRYSIEGLFNNLRKELNELVISSQTSIKNIQDHIAKTDQALAYLKATVDNLPDFTPQYNELKAELDSLKALIANINQFIVDHPIILGITEIDDMGRIGSAVSSINNQPLYAEYAKKDISARDIIDTYATKFELSSYQPISGYDYDQYGAISGINGSALAGQKTYSGNVQAALDKVYASADVWNSAGNWYMENSAIGVITKDTIDDLWSNIFSAG